MKTARTTIQTSTSDYFRAFSFALGFHVLVFFLVFVSIHWSDKISPAMPMQGASIQAIVVNPKVVAAQVKQALEEEKQQKIAEQLALQAKARAVEKARLQALALEAAKQKAEARALAAEAAKLKVQQQKIAQQKALEQQKQVEIALQQKKAEQQAIKKQQAEAAAAAKAQALAAQEKQALEKKLALEKKQVAEKKRALLEKKTLEKKLAAEKEEKKKLAEAQRKKHLQKQIDEQLNAEEAQMAAARTEADSNQVQQFMAQIQNSVESNWNKPAASDQNLKCKLLVQLAPGGSVISVSIDQSSGDTALDQSAITAVYKSQPLPVPEDATIFDKYFRRFTITA